MHTAPMTAARTSDRARVEAFALAGADMLRAGLSVDEAAAHACARAPASDHVAIRVRVEALALRHTPAVPAHRPAWRVARA